jgi:hypothetical protein
MNRVLPIELRILAKVRSSAVILGNKACQCEAYNKMSLLPSSETEAKRYADYYECYISPELPVTM